MSKESVGTDAAAKVDLLVEEQKKFYTTYAAGTPTEGPKSILLMARDLLKQDSPARLLYDDGLFLILHCLVLGGSRYVNKFLKKLETDTAPKLLRVYMTASLKITKGLLRELEDDIRKKKQWNSEPGSEEAASFRWKVAFGEYVYHSLAIQLSIAFNRIHLMTIPPDVDKNDPNPNDPKHNFYGRRDGKMLDDEAIEMVDDIREERKPSESAVVEGYTLHQDTAEDLEKACLDLAEKIPFPEASGLKAFKEAKTKFESAKRLEQIWLKSKGYWMEMKFKREKYSL